MPDAMNKFKDLFCAETENGLNILSRTLLLLEQDPGNLEYYGTLMQNAHTIKGSAATMGYVQMARLAHVLESVFHAGESATIKLDGAAISTALSATDQMLLSLQSIKAEDQELPVASITGALETLLSHQSEVSTKKEVTPPAFSLHDVHAKLLTSDVFAAPTSIRVPVERLDALMGIFEEMLMLRLKLNMLLEPAIDIPKEIADPILKQKLFFIQEFQILFSEFARLLSETQGELLRVRLMPLEHIFGQFPRMIRDLALREGKKVALRVLGGAVELDRTVLEGLGGALAHLLRNAVDHGIAHEGMVTLSAERKNDRIHVIVEDNGVGIDYERVRKVAVKHHIVTATAAEALRSEELGELLFHPNISTNTEVTEISGRGVGLAAVRAFTQDVGGRVSVVSPVHGGRGTRFLLDLPVSLATVKVLIVQASGFTFAVPFANIIRTSRFAPESIVRSAHQEVIMIDERPVPIFWLSRILKITFGEAFRKTVLGAELHAVLISVEGKQVMLVVDACVEEQELLVKSLPSVLRGIKGFSGSTLLPDGRTILLLDVYGLLGRAFGDILESVKSSAAEVTPETK